MAYKEVQRVDISEVVRRWQAGVSRRRIASGTGLSRETVGKYIALAEGMGVSREGPGPTEEQLGTGWPTPATRSSSRAPATGNASPRIGNCWADSR